MSELFSTNLTVCIDAGNLSGYLALAPTVALVSESGVEVGWLPMTSPLQRLSARQPDEPTNDPLAGYKARRAAAREKWARRELERDCERLDITVDNGARRFDSSLAGMGVLFLNEHGGDIASYLTRVYVRAFREGADIEQVDEIARLVGDDDFRVYAGSTGGLELESLQGRMLKAGVFSSPAYVVKGEVFQGRQHLPLLRSKLKDATT